MSRTFRKVVPIEIWDSRDYPRRPKGNSKPFLERFVTRDGVGNFYTCTGWCRHCELVHEFKVKKKSPTPE